MSKSKVRLFSGIVLLALLCVPYGSQVTASTYPTLTLAQTSTHCVPLTSPPAEDTLVYVSTESELWTAVNIAVPHTTILLADGTYNLAAYGWYVWIDTPYVTLRSESGNREAVVLDDNYGRTEIVTIAASNVTVADITIQRARTHAIHVVSTDSGDTLDTLVYNVHIIDPGQQGIKINPGSDSYFPDDGTIACSTVELTDAGRPWIWTINGSCYTGGIDMHQGRDWVIRDNIISGFWCSNGLSEHGIHLWRTCRDPLLERNVLVNNARGIGFGMATSGSARTYDDNPCPDIIDYVDHYGGLMRNNVVYANRAELFASQSGFDSGISLWNACEVEVYHNSVVSTQAPFSSIEWRFSNTSATLTNNLVSHNLRNRTADATVSLSGNLEYAPLSLFVDGAAGDLHLQSDATAAIDQGVSLASGLCDEDYDGDLRPIGAARDIGADEYGISAPAAVTNLRITDSTLAGDQLTITLNWTPPTGAATTTARYHIQLITEVNWESASIFTTGGIIDTANETVTYTGGTLYFAVKTHNEGGWSALSNPAFWPHHDLYLPLIRKAN